MKINLPKKSTFYISLILAVIGFVVFFLPAYNLFAFWLLLVGYVVLVAGLFLKGF